MLALLLCLMAWKLEGYSAGKYVVIAALLQILLTSIQIIRYPLPNFWTPTGLKLIVETTPFV